MLKWLYGVLAAALIAAFVCTSYWGLKNSCSVNHSPNYSVNSGHNENSGSSGPSENDSSQKTKQGNPSGLFELRITAPGTIKGNYQAEGDNKEQPNWTEKFWCDAKLGEFALVVLTLLLFLATFALWLSTQSLVNEAKRTAERQLRAYVSLVDFYTHVRTRQVGPNIKEIQRFEIVPRVINTGVTPAREVDVWSGGIIIDKGDPTPDFTRSNTSENIGHGSIGHSQERMGGTLAIEWDDLRKVHSREIRAFLYIHVKYKDIFGNPCETESCCELIPETTSLSRHIVDGNFNNPFGQQFVGHQNRET
jgi:hypothetical protein